MGWYRGEGGVVLEMDEPLPELMADQLRLGRLVACPPPDDAGGDPLPVAAARPAVNEPKSVWMEYAIAAGMSRADANNATKAELIDTYGGE